MSLKPLVVAIVVVAALLYCGAVVWAGVASIRDGKDGGPPSLPSPVVMVVTAIGGALATHFGALFGITQSQRDPATRNAGGQPSLLDRRVWARSAAIEEGNAAVAAGPADPPLLDRVQVLAAYLYFFALVSALAFWILDGFSDKTADVIKAMSLTFIGVSAAVLSSVLRRQAS